MKSLILLAAILLAVSAPAAYAQQPRYTCQQVRAKSCAELKFIAWWNNVPVTRQASIARKCGVAHCLTQ